MVSLALASIASPLAWYVSRQDAEKGIVSFAREESRRPLMHQDDSHGKGMEMVRRHFGSLLRLQKQIAETHLVEGDLILSVTVSIGIAVMNVTDTNADAPLSCSDIALYRA